MIVDSSAFVAILKAEQDRLIYYGKILDAASSSISSASLLEVSIVMRRLKLLDAEAAIDRLVDELAIAVVPFTAAQAAIARSAHDRFGKGSGHSAQLNFGDCMAYATAIDRGEPLLFKGNDFSQTDVRPA